MRNFSSDTEDARIVRGDSPDAGQENGERRSNKAHVKRGRGVRLRPIGVIRSNIKRRSEAPMQGPEGAPDAWLEVNSFAAQGLDGLEVSNDIIVVTWLHRALCDAIS